MLDKQVNIKVDEVQRETLRQAAAREGMPLSTWLRWLALKRAEEVEARK